MMDNTSSGLFRPQSYRADNDTDRSMNSESLSFGNHAGGCVIRKKNSIRMALHNEQRFSFATIQSEDSAHGRETFVCGLMGA
jgi:hypothetical protein